MGCVRAKVIESNGKFAWIQPVRGGSQRTAVNGDLAGRISCGLVSSNTGFSLRVDSCANPQRVTLAFASLSAILSTSMLARRGGGRAG